MMFTLIVSLFLYSKQMNPQEMNYIVVVLGGVLMFPLVWYYFPVYGGVHWSEGPVLNVDGYMARKWMTPQDVVGAVAESVLPTDKAQERTRPAPRSSSRDFSGGSQLRPLKFSPLKGMSLLPRSCAPRHSCS